MPTPAPTRTGWAAPRGPFPQPQAPPRPDGLAAVCRRRDPTATPLYPLVQHHLETFLADAAAADPDGAGIPQWVEDDFRAYLRCGILAHGFARMRCDACAAERLVAFSCKGRGVCPSCNARRMVEVAAHLTDQVLPPLPLRRCGRDPGCPRPPAQNPACGTTAPGSHLGSWRQSGRSARDVGCGPWVASAPPGV
jgi:hypothetical protein